MHTGRSFAVENDLVNSRLLFRYFTEVFTVRVGHVRNSVSRGQALERLENVRP